MPGFSPAVLRVTRHSAPPDGDIFLAPQYGPTQNGPMILDPLGDLVWFDPIPISDETIVTDFRTQELDGQPVLTWFRGRRARARATGEGVIVQRPLPADRDRPRRERAAAWTCTSSCVTNAGDANAHRRGAVRSSRRAPLGAATRSSRRSTSRPASSSSSGTPLIASSPARSPTCMGAKEPGHAGPLPCQLDLARTNGNLVVSHAQHRRRSTASTARRRRSVGAGRPRTQASRWARARETAFQHDAVVQLDGDLTMFDDGAGPPAVHANSRGLEVALDLDHDDRDAASGRSTSHAGALGDLRAACRRCLTGNCSSDGASSPTSAESTPRASEDFDAHFAAATASYRAYRFPWSGRPSRPPLWRWARAPPAMRRCGRAGTAPPIWMVGGVLAGSERRARWCRSATTRSTTSSRPVSPGIRNSSSPWQDFAFAGQVLSTSATQAVPAHVQIFGAGAFVSSANGLAGLPVGCTRHGRVACPRR